MFYVCCVDCFFGLGVEAGVCLLFVLKLRYLVMAMAL